MKGLVLALLAAGTLVSAQNLGYQVNEPFSPPRGFDYTYNWPSGYRFKPSFRIDGARTDFFAKPYKERKTFYDAKAAFEKVKEYTMNPKTFEELSKKLDFRDIFFNFLVIEDSAVSPSGLGDQATRCNHIVLRDEYGNFYYPYMNIDYPGVRGDSAGVPVDLRNPPENEGFWIAFNGEKSKTMRFGEGYGTKRKVFYLISVTKLNRMTGEETEYSFDTNGMNPFEPFRLKKGRIYFVVSDDGNDLGIGALEDLVQKVNP